MRWALSGAAVAVALCFVLVWQLRETPRVEAAALLQKAVGGRGNARPARATHKRLRITTRTGQMTRVVGVALQASTPAKPKSHACSTPPTTIGTIR